MRATQASAGSARLARGWDHLVDGGWSDTEMSLQVGFGRPAEHSRRRRAADPSTQHRKEFGSDQDFDAGGIHASAGSARLARG